MAAIAGVGLAAGTINTIVGSGSLVTFPTLLAFGLPPVQANVSNTVGLVPGSVSGAVGYRRELEGQRGRVMRLGAASAIGGITGGVLLLVLPPRSFERVVPFLILIAVGLVIAQPWLQRRLAVESAEGRGRGNTAVLWSTVLLTGVYGGYFGAAQGVILLALLGIFVDDHLQRLNGTKNVLAALVNAVAAILFMVVAHVYWVVAGLIAGGAIVGGQAGAVIGRRLSPTVLRWVIVVVGVVVAAKLFQSYY